MSQYLLLLRGQFEPFSDEQREKIIQKYYDWTNKLIEKGIYHTSQELKRDGRVLSAKDGRIVDGPYTETKEAIGGFFLIDAQTYDDAVEISRECPHFSYGGWVEVREINPHEHE